MSRRGNCYDNAARESWFSTLKSELGERFETHGEAKEKLFDHIEVFYNQQPTHSAIGNLSRTEFERAGRSRQAASSYCLRKRVTPTWSNREPQPM
jgi:putative transposase